MKKMFLVSMMVLSLVFAGSAMAVEPHYQGNGNFNIGANAGDGAIDGDYQPIFNGGAGGFSAAGGIGDADASGFIVNGTVSGEVGAIGGGRTDTNAFYGFIENGFYVGSGSQSIAETGGSIDLTVDPSDQGDGWAHGNMSGNAGQLTSDMSHMFEGPINGYTGGSAGQSSNGGFNGSANAADHIDADIVMNGMSGSTSWGSVDHIDIFNVQKMGTNVSAYTNVLSSGNVNGGWVANGGANSVTQLGGANATAVGSYAGSGQLGTNFTGAANGANGGTFAAVTTVNGMNGSIVQAGASMTVTADVTGHVQD